MAFRQLLCLGIEQSLLHDSDWGYVDLKRADSDTVCTYEVLKMENMSIAASVHTLTVDGFVVSIPTPTL